MDSICVWKFYKLSNGTSYNPTWEQQLRVDLALLIPTYLLSFYIDLKLEMVC